MLVRLAFCLWIIVAVSSCCRKSTSPEQVIYIPPSPKDYAWFQYPKGDRVFKNQNGDLDTLVAKDYFEHNTEFSNETNLKHYNTCEPFYLKGYLSGRFINTNDTLNERYLRLTSSSHEMHHTPEMLMEVSMGSNNVNRFILEPDSTMFLNGVNYNDVFIFHDLVQHDTVFSKIFKTVFYSKSTGPIKYVKPNGDVWELIN